MDLCWWACWANESWQGFELSATIQRAGLNHRWSGSVTVKMWRENTVIIWNYNGRSHSTSLVYLPFIAGLHNCSCKAEYAYFFPFAKHCSIRSFWEVIKDWLLQTYNYKRATILLPQDRAESAIPQQDTTAVKTNFRTNYTYSSNNLYVSLPNQMLWLCTCVHMHQMQVRWILFSYNRARYVIQLKQN